MRKPKEYIDPTELRPGNIAITETGKIAKVAYVGETIGFHNLAGGTDRHQKDPIWSEDITKIRGLRLEAWILEKGCGFSMEHRQRKNPVRALPSDQRLGDFFLHAGHHEWWFFSNSYAQSTVVFYLHHLQNLYRYIVGQELKLNEEYILNLEV